MATILLVDDLQFIKKMEKAALENHGHTIVGDASDGEQAIELYRQTRADVVLMDITMPKMNGLDAMMHILEINKKAKVIICSALDNQHVLIKAVKAGASEYLVKPYTMEKLVHTIEKVINA